MRRALIRTAALLCLATLGCRSTLEQAVQPVFSVAELAENTTVLRDLPYREGEQAHSEKHRLDLYLPDPRKAAPGPLPVLVFVHGGSLAQGDKDLEVVGLDFYRNIGRFYSSHGAAVALVNYRLQPEVSWREQIDDVAAAAGWVHRELPQLAGVEQLRLVLAGHSAGAWLVLRVAVSPVVRALHGLEGAALSGVVSVSGSGFEMTDRRTWELYDKEDFWAERFAVDPPADWRVEASVAPLVGDCECARGEPLSLRFLLLYSNQELQALGRQNRLLAEELARRDALHRVVAVSSESHRRTVMAMSHPRKIVSREILSFLFSNRVDLSPRAQRQLVRPRE